MGYLKNKKDDKAQKKFLPKELNFLTPQKAAIQNKNADLIN